MHESTADVVAGGSMAEAHAHIEMSIDSAQSLREGKLVGAKCHMVIAHLTGRASNNKDNPVWCKSCQLASGFSSRAAAGEPALS